MLWKRQWATGEVLKKAGDGEREIGEQESDCTVRFGEFVAGLEINCCPSHPRSNVNDSEGKKRQLGLVNAVKNFKGWGVGVKKIALLTAEKNEMSRTERYFRRNGRM